MVADEADADMLEAGQARVHAKALQATVPEKMTPQCCRLRSNAVRHCEVSLPEAPLRTAAASHMLGRCGRQRGATHVRQVPGLRSSLSARPHWRDLTLVLAGLSVEAPARSTRTVSGLDSTSITA